MIDARRVPVSPLFPLPPLLATAAADTYENGARVFVSTALAPDCPPVDHLLLDECVLLLSSSIRRRGVVDDCLLTLVVGRTVPLVHRARVLGGVRPVDLLLSIGASPRPSSTSASAADAAQSSGQSAFRSCKSLYFMLCYCLFLFFVLVDVKSTLPQPLSIVTTFSFIVFDRAPPPPPQAPTCTDDVCAIYIAQRRAARGANVVRRARRRHAAQGPKYLDE
jgi:hypothetical protein